MMSAGPFAKRQKLDADQPLAEPRTIVVWNANALLHRVDKNGGALRSLLATVSPDVLYVSEVRMPAEGPPGAKAGDGRPRSHDKLSTATKAAREEAERLKSFIASAGYRVYWSLAEKKYAGSALLVKRTCAPPAALRFSIDAAAPPQRHDPEGRVIVATWASFELCGTYVPNNGSSEESFARRRGWDAKVSAWLTARRAAAVPPPPLIWGGDLNVAAAWEDVGPDPSWFREKNGQGHAPKDCGQPGFTPAEQERFAELLLAGDLLDAVRLTHPEPDWRRDVTWRGTPGAPPNPPEFGRYYGKGMRIDYLLLERPLRSRLVRTEVLGRGFEREGFVGSDHCPLLLELSAVEAAAAEGAANEPAASAVAACAP